MLSVLFLSAYFSSLITFSFVSHPVTYCVLLMIGVLGASGYVYLLFGFSWYLVLFCLVYIGGVYVLFIFVSVHVPNPSPALGGGVGVYFFSFLFLGFLFSFVGLGVPCFVERSYYLCSFFEGFSYCLFCLVLMVGFVRVRVVVGEKDSFFR